MKNVMNFVSSSEEVKHPQNGSSVYRKAGRKPSATLNGSQNVQDDGSTNNGWDIVTCLDDTSLTNLSKNLMISQFPLTVDDNDYIITIPKSYSAGEIASSNMISVSFQMTAEPTSNNPNATPFSGVAQVSFDASEMTLNAVRNANYLSLDGTNSYLTASSSSTFNTSTGVTLEAWVKLDTPVPNDNQIICGFSDTDNASPAMYISSSGTKLSLRWGSDNYSSSELPNLTGGNWHHVAASVDSSSVTFYVDGFPQGNEKITSQSGNASTFCIGYLKGDSASEYFSGDITDVRVWTTSRSKDDIQTYMNINMANESGTVISNLVQLWKFTGDIYNPVNLINNAVGTNHGNAHVEQVASTTKARYVINFKTASINLDVESSFSGNTDMQDPFNTALAAAITKNILPYALPLKVTFAFQTYGGIVIPTNAEFITLENTKDTSGKTYQLMALAMCNHSTFPSGNAATLFSKDSTLMVPINSSTNLISSVSDYHYLSVHQAALEAATSLDFELKDVNGQYQLQYEGSQELGKWYYFTKLKSYFVYIVTGQGIKRSMSLSSLLFNISKAQMTLVLTPEARSSSGVQEISRTFTDVEVEVGINWVFFGVVCAIFMLIGLWFGPWGAVIMALLLYFVFYKWLKKLTGKVQKLIYDKLVDHNANNVNTNANLTIKNILYDEAIIGEAALGSAAFDMTVINPDENAAVVTYEESDTLELTFINNYTGDAIQFSNSSKDPSVITITMPDFMQSAVPGMKLEGNSSWKTGTSGSGNSEVLTLTNLDGGTWKNGEDLKFTITDVYCTYLNRSKQPIASGAVLASITSTNYHIIETAARVSLQGVNPDSTEITFSLVNNDAGNFTITNQKTSPQPHNTDERKFTWLIEGTYTQQEGTQTISTDWQLGYKNVSKGMEAWVQQTDDTSVNYSGSPIKYDPDNTKAETVAYIEGSGNNPGIEIQFYFPADSAEQE